MDTDLDLKYIELAKACGVDGSDWHNEILEFAYQVAKHTRKQLMQREWVGLTDEEVIACWSDGFNACEQKTVADLRNFIARAIELKFKEKNA